MQTVIVCPSCGKSYQVSEEHLGRQGRCKQCGAQFTFTRSDSHPPVATAASESTAENESRDAAGFSTPSGQAGPRRKAADPQKLGRFEIRERLGTGGFGAVYRAYDPQLQRDVALKLLQLTGDKQRDQQRIDRFLIEGRAAASLQHPHIVPVFDAGSDEQTGEYYMAAAFIDGQTLAAAIDGQPLEVGRVAVIVRKLASALDYAHQQGILHRDVKPENVMLDAKDEPHLMDFGLARLENSDEKLTRDGAVMGTPAYMSPEQCQGQQEELGPASDQYSLGCVLYELLTGQTPFSGPPPIQVHNHLNVEPDPPSQRNAEVARDLDTICLKALSKAPQERYGSCVELAEDLRRWQANEPIHARPMNRLQRLARWCRREPVVAGLLGAVLVAFTLGFVISTWQWRRASLSAAREYQAKHALELRQRQLAQALEDAQQQATRADSAVVTAQREAHEKEVALQRILRQVYASKMREVQSARDLGRHTLIRKLLSDNSTSECEMLRGWEWDFSIGCYPEPSQSYSLPGGHGLLYAYPRIEWSRVKGRLLLSSGPIRPWIHIPPQPILQVDVSTSWSIKEIDPSGYYATQSQESGLIAIQGHDGKTLRFVDHRTDTTIGELGPVDFRILDCEWSPAGDLIAVCNGDRLGYRGKGIGGTLVLFSPPGEHRGVERILQPAYTDGLLMVTKR